MQQGGFGGYGPPPPQQQQLAPKKSGCGLWIALGAILLLVVVGAGAAALYFFVLAKPAPHLARYAPKSTSVYVEIPSFQRAIISGATMKPLDSSRIDDKLLTQDIVLAFTKAFTMSNDDARAVVQSLDASAIIARDTNDLPKAAWMITFSNAAPVEKLLHTTRFAESGPFVAGGVRYTLERRAPSELSPNAGIVEAGLSEMETGHGTRALDLVWFPKKKILVLGDDQVTTDIGAVIDGTTDSLEKNDAYKRAKKTFESGSDVAFFFDTHDLDDVRRPADKKLIDGYLQNRDPVTGAIKLVKAGVMMDVHATLTGTNVPPDELIPPAPKLAFPRKLPQDTVAYMALSTKTKMTGAMMRASLLRGLASSDPSSAKQMQEGLESMETGLGFKFDDVIDMTGDETALAIVADPSFKLDTTNGIADELGSFGLVWALGVKDDARAKAILGKVRAQLETPDVAKVAKVRTIGPDSWEVDPDTASSFPLPNLTVKYDGKLIVAVLAGPSLTMRALGALQGGKDTLGSNPAHELAFAAMPQDAHFYMWMDTGRITSVMMDGASHVRKGAVSSPLPIDAIRLTGPDRVTSAIAIRSTLKNGAWTVDMDSLNLPATALFSVAKDLDLGSAMPRGNIFGPGTNL